MAADPVRAVDALTLAAVRRELEQDLVGARVARVDQPERRKLFLELERDRQRRGLLLSADGQLARAHQAAQRPARPPVPPAFALLLRKHLEGSRLVAVEQPNLDRLLHLRFEGFSAIGEPQAFVLAAEAMGPYSNVVLFRAGDGIILGAIDVVDESMSDRRWIGPGERYVPPVLGDRPQWYDLADAGQLGQLLQGLVYPERPRRLAERIGGLSRAGWEYVLALTGGEPSALNLAAALGRLKEIVTRGEFEPHRAPGGYSVLPPAGEAEVLPVSVLLEDYYGDAERRLAVARLRRELGAVLQRELERLRKREAIHAGQAAAEGEAEGLRHLGDLLTANLYRLREGEPRVELEDYADPAGGTVFVELDPALPLAANAQRYYHRYRKVLETARQARQQLESCRRDLAYLEQVALDADLAERADELEAIRDDMAREGLVRVKAPRGGRKPRDEGPTQADLLRFRSSQGLAILAGKNNRQNDYLTLKLAHPRDIWLHTQIIPGAHVLIRTGGGRHDVPEATLREAAQIAAFYSQARLSSNVPVVYTERRHVSKPNGAKPGMVIYEQEKTLFATPDPAAVAALRDMGDASARV